MAGNYWITRKWQKRIPSKMPRELMEYYRSIPLPPGEEHALIELAEQNWRASRNLQAKVWIKQGRAYLE